MLPCFDQLMRILVIEDSERLRRSLGHGLRKAGYSIDLVADGREGLAYAMLNAYDVVLLDLLLPTLDGLTVLRRLRAAGNKSPVLILSAKDQVEDRVQGLQLGADDYLVKPFSFDELCARIQTLIRRKYDAVDPDLTVGRVRVNTATKSVRIGQNVVYLTPGEYAVLEFLVLNRGRVKTKEQILDAIHDSDTFTGTNVVEVMICNLRKKLNTGDDAAVIHTRRGYGYFVE